MINYNFKHLENVPVQYMSNSQVADAVELDALISPVKAIQQKYDMDRVVDDVVRTNQEAINLANSSRTKNDLYPRANNFEGDDGDRLGRLHNEMDEAGDEAHDEDFEKIPSFANNTPENRWRDLRALADSTFDAGELEEIVKRKKNNQVVNHSLRKIEEDISDWIGVKIAGDKSQGDETEPSPGIPEGEEPEDSQREMNPLVIYAIVGILAYVISR